MWGMGLVALQHVRSSWTRNRTHVPCFDRWILYHFGRWFGASLVAQLVKKKKSTCNVGDLGSIPGLVTSPGERSRYQLQCSGLENSMHCYGPLGGKESDTTERLSRHFTSSPLDHQGSHWPSLTPSPAQPGRALGGRSPDFQVSRDHPLPARGCYLLCGLP